MSDQIQPWYQQGDVTIKPVPSLPAGATPANTNVLRQGSATGHAHRAVADDVVLLIKGEALFMDAPSGARIEHEEHAAFDVPPGTYQIGDVLEYDHFMEEARVVVD